MRHKRIDSGDTTEFANRLLEVVRRLTLELAPERSRHRITLDSQLERELGFDSLSRVELLLRLERELNVRLADTTISTAETPRDLMHAALDAPTPPRDFAHPPAPGPVEAGTADAIPDEVDTLQAVLAWRATHTPARTHVLLYEMDADEPVSITFADLQRGAEAMASGLKSLSLEHAEAVAIMLPTGREYLESFFGVLMAGGIPVPIYPPGRPSQLEDHLRRHTKILENAGARMLITVPEGRAIGRLIGRQVARLRAVVTPGEVLEHAGAGVRDLASPDDIAFLQYTSGSTGQPKGVILTHANLLANIRAMGEWVHAEPEDVFVSWLPLYHDMGLIGAWLGCLYYAMTSVLMPPTTFLARPWRWLQAIQEHRGTITAAPNFAYELCLEKIPERELTGLDLSSLRLAFNGAEPVSPRTLRRFTERFAGYGLGKRVLAPVYGLAEATVGLAFPPLDRGPLIDRIQHDTFERTGRAVPAPDSERALEFAACGQPLTGYEIRIVDDGDREVSDRVEGHLQFRGPSTTRGYQSNPDATASLFHEDWLDSGDLAYIGDSDVYLTGRVKDIIIRAGRNIYPYELEDAVGELPGIRDGCVAVFGSAAAGADIEQLIVVAETREADADTRSELRLQIEALSTDMLGARPDDVLLVPPRSVLKTSSGKLRRAACRELYEQGQLGHGPRAAWRQYVRLWTGGLLPLFRLRLRALGDSGFALRAHAAFGVAAAMALPVLALTPGLTKRWRALGWCIRAGLRMAGIPVLVQGKPLPPADGCVFVANHGSYLDAPVLTSSLASPVVFVTKKELEARPFARWVLSRIGARFVERFDAGQSTDDARELTRLAHGGPPLLFFPEGTFTRHPGLLGFHIGAFLTAVENGLPIVPITIRGTRSVLREDAWFPRRGTIAIVIGDPIHPHGNDWHAAVDLRNRTRQHILGHLGEQDLVLERGFAS